MSNFYGIRNFITPLCNRAFFKIYYLFTKTKNKKIPRNKLMQKKKLNAKKNYKHRKRTIHVVIQRVKKTIVYQRFLQLLRQCSAQKCILSKGFGSKKLVNTLHSNCSCGRFQVVLPVKSEAKKLPFFFMQLYFLFLFHGCFSEVVQNQKISESIPFVYKPKCDTKQLKKQTLLEVSARNGMFLVKTWQVWSHKTTLFQNNSVTL